MNFSQPHADIYVPAGDIAPETALASVTHLCIAAHQDDIEIMAHAGITAALDAPTQSFGGVVVTDGAGSPRTGPYAHLSDLEMQAVRREEQRRAAQLGHYAIQLQLAHPSSAVKQPGHPAVVADLIQILSTCRPRVLYLHSPADKHDTHVALLLRCFEALQALPLDQRPRQVLGCEVWRDLDWMIDADKVALDSGRHPELAAALLLAFDSQVAGGKRYDLATLGRRAAHATFHTSHATDRLKGITWAMELTPALTSGGPSLRELTLAHLQRFQTDVELRLNRFA